MGDKCCPSRACSPSCAGAGKTAQEIQQGDEENRTFLVVTNWRMYGNKAQISDLIKCIKKLKIRDKEIIIAPPAIYLEYTHRLAGNIVQVACQNCYYPDKGPYTGEISPAMLRDMCIEWVILGYSDRRYTFCESDELIAYKVGYALNCGLNVILCVSDTLKDCKEGKTMEAIFRQLKCVSNQVTNKHHWHKVVIAYEPVWATGLCKPPDPQQVQDILACIRTNFSKCINAEAAASMRIIYGGCISGDNCDEYAIMPDIDGFLINEYVLKPGFNEILNVNPIP
ncbi:triosephosphate isomerase-like [Diorhabda carinulata]|uniref:triosephosphate isomerase-like n=1 Tax=Diorhabda carinulata TaxID=1163345 RepID=UPI0025A1A716|nr:triosephosphate isomerase-like [Diorhabda carinulata]